jgi:serine/threonine protein phosphatase PrpC
VTAVVVGNRLLVANVGDSRAVLSRSGKGEGSQFTNSIGGYYQTL